jgi:Spy/CpxP family protein refolding chaperone
MYPGFISHWRRERCGERRAAMSYGSPGHAGRARAWEYGATGEEDPGQFGFAGGSFGVRRPLRFLAYKLQLDEKQVGELARILDEIKTERAQAAVDHRRAISVFADAIEGDVFDENKAGSGADLRLESANRLRSAVLSALGRLHKLLDPEQRARLAYLIRTGTLSI